jgi:hypothetical protein
VRLRAAYRALRDFLRGFTGVGADIPRTDAAAAREAIAHRCAKRGRCC